MGMIRDMTWDVHGRGIRCRDNWGQMTVREGALQPQAWKGDFTSPGHLRDISGTSPGHLRDISGTLQDISGTSPGQLQAHFPIPTRLPQLCCAVSPLFGGDFAAPSLEVCIRHALGRVLWTYPGSFPNFSAFCQFSVARVCVVAPISRYA